MSSNLQAIDQTPMYRELSEKLLNTVSAYMEKGVSLQVGYALAAQLLGKLSALFPDGVDAETLGGIASANIKIGRASALEGLKSMPPQDGIGDVAGSA